MPRQNWSQTASVPTLTGTIPISKGGTNANNKVTAVNNLGGVSRSRLDIPNGVASLDQYSKISPSAITATGDSILTMIEPYWKIVKGTISAFQISNYDSRYDISVTSSSHPSLQIIRVNDTIKIDIPLTNSGFTLNIDDRAINIVPKTDSINRPSKLRYSIQEVPSTSSHKFIFFHSRVETDSYNESMLVPSYTDSKDILLPNDPLLYACIVSGGLGGDGSLYVNIDGKLSAIQAKAYRLYKQHLGQVESAVHVGFVNSSTLDENIYNTYPIQLKTLYSNLTDVTVTFKFYQGDSTTSYFEVTRPVSSTGYVIDLPNTSLQAGSHKFSCRFKGKSNITGSYIESPWSDKDACTSFVSLPAGSDLTNHNVVVI